MTTAPRQVLPGFLRFILSLGAVVMLGVADAAAAPPAAPGSGRLDEFLVLYTVGWGHPHVEWPTKEADIDRLAASIKAAGFNVVTGTWQEGRTLPALKRHGLRLLVDFHGDPKFRPRDQPAAAQKLCESLRGEPGVWGYFLFDGAANEQQARRLSRTIDDVRRWDPTHLAYVNVFRDGYKFAPLFENPNVLSYHYYQWWYGLRGEGFYERLEKMRAIAHSKGCPLILWQSVAMRIDERVQHLAVSADTVYEPGDAGRMRHGVYSALAYGVQGIEWFLAYAMTDPARREFIVPNGADSGPYRLIEAANLTRAGRDVLSINRELKHLGPVLVGLTSEDVFHTPTSDGRQPAETRPIPPNFWVQIPAGDAVLGVLRDDRGREHLLAANRRAGQPQSLALRFSGPIQRVELFDRQRGGWRAAVLRPCDKAADATARRGLVRRRRVTPSPSSDAAELRLDLAAGDGELLRMERP